jgi:DNA/RNA-binding domain of Phe-tRNA-synthetase-like protein
MQQAGSERGVEVEVDPAVQAAFRDYTALVVLASGITNGPSDAESEQQLARAEAELRDRGLTRATDHPHIASWRAAFSAFGAKPSRYPCSAEALIARVLKGDRLPRVNALVDLYNSVSVRRVVPLGGEDADQLHGPLRLTVASGDEAFDPRDDGAEVETAQTGEVVWRDDVGVTCRRWNWRQGRRTQLTEHTTRALFVFDRLDGLTAAELQAAADELSDLVRLRWPTCDLTRLR